MDTIQYEELNEAYINDALSLVLASYNKQRTAISCLPIEQWYVEGLKKSITFLFKEGTGIMATDKGQLVGFLVGIEIDEFFGKEKGVYCPVHGHGVKQGYDNQLYNELYKRAADSWVKQQLMTHAVTLYSYDLVTIDKWFWMGFGLRCVDSIRESKAIDLFNQSIDIKKVAKNSVNELAQLHGDHIAYYRSSPIFMPTEEEDPIKDLYEWLENENHHLFVAYIDNNPVGYMRIQPQGESFISRHPSIMNVTGAYVMPNKRNDHIGTLLLSKIQQWLLEHHYPLCGVDFESLNTTGSQFWNKHFVPYTYSLVRRIDERINI